MTEATRQLLIDSGRRAFSEEGLEGARVDRIAKDAGMNKALINYHFRGKEGLYLAVLAEELEAVAAAMEEALSSAKDDAARLESWPEAFWAALEGRPELAPLLLRELLGGCRGLADERLQALTRSWQLLAGASFPLRLALMGSLLIARVAEPLRERLAEVGGPAAREDEADQLLPLLRALAGRGT